jgi:hypothetical protein
VGMATISFPLETAVLPASGGGTLTSMLGNPGVTYAPFVTHNKLTCPVSVDSWAIWTFSLAPNFMTTPTATVAWTTSTISGATNGSVMLVAGATVGRIGIDSLPPLSFGYADLSGVQALPAATTTLNQATWLLTATQFVAGQLVSLFIGRAGTHALDTAPGGIDLHAVNLTYQTL